MLGEENRTVYLLLLMLMQFTPCTIICTQNLAACKDFRLDAHLLKI